MGGADLAPARAEFTLNGVGAGPWVPGLIGSFNAMVWGVFVGSIVLEATFDGGATAFAVKDEDGAPYSMSAPDLVAVRQDEPGVLHRMRAVAWTSGAAQCRLSGGAPGR